MFSSNKKRTIWRVAGTIAMLALAPVLAASPASAFGHGGGGGGRGGGGSHGGGFGGGYHGGGFAGAYHGGTFHSSPAFAGANVRSSFASTNTAVVRPNVAVTNGQSWSGRWQGGQWHGGQWHGDRHHHHRFFAFGFGGYVPYGYDDFYDNGYYDDTYVYDTAPTVTYSQGDASYCAQTYRSYDPSSGTYLGYDGLRHPCP